MYVHSKDAGKLFNKNKLKWYTHILCAQLTHGPAQPGPLFSVMHTNVNTIVWPIHQSRKVSAKFCYWCVFSLLFGSFSFLSCLLWLCVLCVCYVQIRRLKPNIPNAVCIPKALGMAIFHTFSAYDNAQRFPWLSFICSFSFWLRSPHHSATLSENLFLCLWAHFFTPFSHMYTFFSISFRLSGSFFFIVFFLSVISIHGAVYFSCHAARPLLYVRHFPYCYCYRFVVPSFLLRVRTFLPLIFFFFKFFLFIFRLYTVSSRCTKTASVYCYCLFYSSLSEMGHWQQ